MSKVTCDNPPTAFMVIDPYNVCFSHHSQHEAL
jgi:hypothetical protein